jgi:4-hydroxy-tetrahydrodipicolinate synthase
MPHPVFRGSITALVTPFRDGEVDEAAFARLVERQIAAGTHGLVPVGTTGEAASLTSDERRRVVELCVDVARGRVPVIAGAGSDSTAETIERVRHAKTVGCDAALVVTPYYVRPSQEGLYRHYAALNEAVQMPVFIYDVPSRTSVSASVETLARLARLPNMIGIKDATGDLGKASLIRTVCHEGFVALSGNDDTALGYMAHGGGGCISVTANVAPGACAAFQNACMAGDFETALAWQDRLIVLHKALFADASPAPAKFAMATLGLCSEEVRSPLAPCAEAVRPQITAAMRDAGVL